MCIFKETTWEGFALSPKNHGFSGKKMPPNKRKRSDWEIHPIFHLKGRHPFFRTLQVTAMVTNSNQTTTFHRGGLITLVAHGLNDSMMNFAADRSNQKGGQPGNEKTMEKKMEKIFELPPLSSFVVVEIDLVGILRLVMIPIIYTSLKLTANATGNGWLEYDHFLLGPGSFSGASC